MKSIYILESQFANLEYRMIELRKEFKELLIELLPEEGFIDISYDDELGDEIECISKHVVRSSTNEYPISEMSIHDMKEAISALLNYIKSNQNKPI